MRCFPLCLEGGSSTTTCIRRPPLLNVDPERSDREGVFSTEVDNGGFDDVPLADGGLAGNSTYTEELWRFRDDGCRLMEGDSKLCSALRFCGVRAPVELRARGSGDAHTGATEPDG